jgi:putative phosphoesterase
MEGTEHMGGTARRRGEQLGRHRIGVISDTHGLLRPEAEAVLQGSQLILHAGDIGDPTILTRLAAIAPVHAVRGNNDRGSWADELPELAEIRIAGRRIWILHDLSELEDFGDPAEIGVDAVVAGHSHRPLAEQRGRTLYFNPGSAGPRRFSLPISVGVLWISGAGSIEHELVALSSAR